MLKTLQNSNKISLFIAYNLSINILVMLYTYIAFSVIFGHLTNFASNFIDTWTLPLFIFSNIFSFLSRISFIFGLIIYLISAYQFWKWLFKKEVLKGNVEQVV